LVVLFAAYNNKGFIKAVREPLATKYETGGGGVGGGGGAGGAGGNGATQIASLQFIKFCMCAAVREVLYTLN
jgi:hypothetical protein